MQSDHMNRLYYVLQSQMNQVGGKLPSLALLQKTDEIGDNSIEQESVTPPQEGTFIMMNNAAVANPEVAAPQPSIVPPAGGHAEHAVGAQVVDFLKAAGLSVPKKRTWQDQVLEHAIPVGRTVAAVLIAEGVIALVQHQVQKRREKNELAAAKADAMLTESISS